MTARAKGLREGQCAVRPTSFRNAMLIVIRGVSGGVRGRVLRRLAIIETIFSLDGLGRLGVRWRAVSR